MIDDQNPLETPDEGLFKKAESTAQSVSIEPVQMDDNQKINTFRELILGPEKKEMEGQLQGMKDLFTSMLVENRKEYQHQLSDIKDLFINILEENRKTFQIQLQELYDQLPRLIDHGMRYSSAEQHIYVSEVNDVQAQEKLDRYNRIDAVKEIMLGGNIKQIEDSFVALKKTSSQFFEDDQKVLFSMAEEINNQIKMMESNISQRVNEYANSLSTQIKANNQKQSQKNNTSQLLREFAENILK